MKIKSVIPKRNAVFCMVMGSFLAVVENSYLDMRLTFVG